MITTLLLALSVSSCGLLRKKPGPPQPASPRVTIGSIQMTNPELGFALIHTPVRAAIPAGADLISSNEGGETSRMKMSPERKGPFMTADIVSGNPVKGDAVIWLRGETTASTAAAPEEPAPVDPSARITLPAPAPAPESELPPPP